MTGLRQKMAKDAPVFNRNPARGEVHYPPFEVSDKCAMLTKKERQELAENHRRFNIYPNGDEDGLIRDYVRHIPYNSEKKAFSDKTGREAFEREQSQATCVTLWILTRRSVSVHFHPTQRAQQEVHRHVGLSDRPCTNHTFLQSMQLSQDTAQ